MLPRSYPKTCKQRKHLHSHSFLLFIIDGHTVHGYSCSPPLSLSNANTTYSFLLSYLEVQSSVHYTKLSYLIQSPQPVCACFSCLISNPTVSSICLHITEITYLSAPSKIHVTRKFHVQFLVWIQKCFQICLMHRKNTDK